jgi:hypothetical protein
MLVDTRTGERVDPILVDPATHEPIKAPDYVLTPGPAAGDRTKLRYAATRTAGGAMRDQAADAAKPGRRKLALSEGKPAARRRAPSSS